MTTNSATLYRETKTQLEHADNRIASLLEDGARLRALNAELLEALEAARDTIAVPATALDATPEDVALLAKADAAIAKARGNATD